MRVFIGWFYSSRGNPVHWENYSESSQFKPKYDCSYHAPIDLDQQTDTVCLLIQINREMVTTIWFRFCINEIPKSFLCVCGTLVLYGKSRLLKIASLGIMVAQLRVPLNSLNMITLWWSEGVSGRPSIGHTWLPEDSSLSDVYMSVRFFFHSWLVGFPIWH